MLVEEKGIGKKNHNKQNHALGKEVGLRNQRQEKGLGRQEETECVFLVVVFKICH